MAIDLVALATAAALAAMPFQSSSVQSFPPQQDFPATAVPDVVVSAPADNATVGERAQRFVEQLSEPVRGKALARWNTRLCVGVANMPAAPAQTIIDRIAVVGSALGVQFEGPGCKAQVMIIAVHTADADTVARTAVHDDADMFRPSRSGTDLGSAALRAFTVSQKPVRWWHVSMPTNVQTGEPAVILNGEDAYVESPSGDPDPIPRVTIVNTMSRLTSSIRNDLSRVFIIVDVDKAGDAPLSALADYLTLITLTQVDPDVDVSSADSILNLFSGSGDRPTGLTEWDAAFLIALYASKENPGVVSQQHRDLGRRVANIVDRPTN